MKTISLSLLSLALFSLNVETKAKSSHHSSNSLHSLKSSEDSSSSKKSFNEKNFFSLSKKVSKMKGFMKKMAKKIKSYKTMAKEHQKKLNNLSATNGLTIDDTTGMIKMGSYNLFNAHDVLTITGSRIYKASNTTNTPISSNLTSTSIVYDINKLIWDNLTYDVSGTLTSVMFKKGQLTDMNASQAAAVTVLSFTGDGSRVMTATAGPTVIADTDRLVWVNVAGSPAVTSLYYDDVETMTVTSPASNEINIITDVSRYVRVTSSSPGSYDGLGFGTNGTITVTGGGDTMDAGTGSVTKVDVIHQIGAVAQTLSDAVVSDVTLPTFTPTPAAFLFTGS